MPVSAHLVVRTPVPLTESELGLLRARLLRECPEAVSIGFFGEPFGCVTPGDEASSVWIPTRDSSGCWYDLYFVAAYYGPGYERGYLPHFLEVAEWLERAIPGSEIWYGHDGGDDDALTLCDASARARLRAYFDKVGYEPYDSKFRQFQRPSPGTS